MIDKYYVPTDKRDADIHYKARIQALSELLEQISDDKLETVGQVRGLIHNNIEEVEKELNGDSDED